MKLFLIQHAPIEGNPVRMFDMAFDASGVPQPKTYPSREAAEEAMKSMPQTKDAKDGEFFKILEFQEVVT